MDNDLNFTNQIEQRLYRNIKTFTCYVLIVLLAINYILFSFEPPSLVIAMLLPIPVLLICPFLPKKPEVYIPLIKALIINSVLYAIIMIYLEDYSSLWMIFLSAFTLFSYCAIWAFYMSWVYEDIMDDRKKLLELNSQDKSKNRAAM